MHLILNHPVPLLIQVQFGDRESWHQCGFKVQTHRFSWEKMEQYDWILPPVKESQDLVHKQEWDSRRPRDRLGQQLQRCQTINFHGCHTSIRSHFDSSLKRYEVCMFSLRLCGLSPGIIDGCEHESKWSFVSLCWPCSELLTCLWYAVQKALVTPTPWDRK